MIPPHRLHHDDPLPARPERVVVAGPSGSGKSTLARRLGELLHVPYTELDALHHGPGWTMRPTFVADVERFVAGPAWVCEFQYAPVRPLLAERADLMVFLLYPRRVVMARVIRRTLRRRLRREQLWNGNVEPPLRTFFTDREHIVRWAWRTHATTAARYAEYAAQPGRVTVALRSPAETEAWLAGPLARSLAAPR